MTPNQFAEAKRLHQLGFRLCELHPNSKRPVGDGWNNRAVDVVREDAGGYGLLLALNDLCSVDVDNEPLCREGLSRCGFDLEALRASGVYTMSTRPGSGGRITFRVPDGAPLRWIKFSSRTHGTILELRAASPNLQDSLPGTVYKSQDGSGPWEQQYADFMTLDCACEPPAGLLAWWSRLSTDVEFLREQQSLFVGEDAQLAVSSGDGKLAYASAHRMAFNATNDVADVLLAHGYAESRNGRFAPPTATGAAAVRRIPGREELWQSDHASDPLHGTFDAWTAHVVLDHGGDLQSAERAAETTRALVAVEGFEEETVVTRIENSEESCAEQLPMPNLERDKTGKIKATVNNLLAVLRRGDLTGFDIGTDTFRDEIMISDHGTAQWRTFSDSDYVRLRSVLETGATGFAQIGRELVRDVVLYVADENKFDSAILWIEQLTWDGVPRIDTFLVDNFSAEDTPYHRAVSAYMWTAMAGRVLFPGCKADMVPILVGNQGVGKSTAVGAMVPSPEFFTELSFSEKDDDLSRKMRGKLLAEIGELRGLHTKELEAIKAFITRTHEHWIPKYREFETTFPRRLLFIGTTNKEQFLADDTGNRRWLPVRVGQVSVDKVRAVAAQCWAEAAVRFQSGGVLWKAAQTLALDVQDEFAFHDEWEIPVLNWIEKPLFDDQKCSYSIRVHDALVGAIGLDPRNIKRAEEMRMGAVLRKLGYERKKIRHEGHLTWAYVPSCSLLENR